MIVKKWVKASLSASEKFLYFCCFVLILHFQLFVGFLDFLEFCENHWNENELCRAYALHFTVDRHSSTYACEYEINQHCQNLCLVWPMKTCTVYTTLLKFDKQGLMSVHIKHTIAGYICSRERSGCQKPASATESILWGVLSKPCAWHAGTGTHSGGSEAGCPAAGKSECPELSCVLSLAPLVSPNTPAFPLPPQPLGQVEVPAPFPAPLDRAASPVDRLTLFFLQWGKSYIFLLSSCSLLKGNKLLMVSPKAQKHHFNQHLNGEELFIVVIAAT